MEGYFIALRHVPELDGIRAFAAIAVVAFHTWLPGLPGGFLGVDVFFVLSGYLTASIALSGKYDFNSFMIRRLRRLWPLLIFVCANVTFFYSLIAMPLNLSEVLPSSVFLGNFATSYFGVTGPLSHTWTLANEMQFYALVAVLAIAFPRRTFRFICIVLFVTATLARLRYAQLGAWELGYFNPLTHSSGLFVGAIVATLSFERLRSPSSLFIMSSTIVLVAFVTARYRSLEALTIWIAIAELGSAGLISSIVKGAGSASAILRTPFIRSLGTLSYGIYLWHYPIAVLLRETFTATMAFVLTLLASLVLAALSYRFVEHPIRKSSRERLDGRRLPHKYET